MRKVAVWKIMKQKQNCRSKNKKKKPLLLRSRTGDFFNMQDTVRMPTDLLDMRGT
jgi:hypothetical protein